MSRQFYGAQRYLLLPLMSLAVMATLLMSWLVATAPGADWVLRRTLEALPYEVEIGKISGNLATGLELKNLRLSLPEYRLEIATAKGKWQLLALLDGQFRLKSLQLDKVNIRQTGINTVEKKTPWPALAPPFPVVVDRLAIRDLHLQRLDASPLVVDKLDFQGVLSRRHFQIARLSIANTHGSLALAGKLASRFPYQHKLSLLWRYGADSVQFSGSGRLEGDITASRLRHGLSSPLSIQTSGQLGLANSRDHMALSADKFSFDLEHQWQQAVIQLADLTIAGEGKLSQRGTGSHYELRAETGFNAVAESGTAAGLRLFPDQQVAEFSRQFFPATLSLEAAGTADALDIARADLVTATGSGSVAGDIHWQQGLHWSLTIAMDQLSLLPVLPQWPAKVSGQLASSGNIEDGDLAARLEASELTGTLRDVPFSGQFSAEVVSWDVGFGEAVSGQVGSGDVAPGEILIHALAFSMAGNQLNAEGKIGAVNDIDWELQAPDLRSLGLGVSGSLHSSGSVQGTLASPLIAGELSGKNLGYQQWSVQELQADAATGADNHLDLEGNLKGINHPGLAIGNLHILADGSPGNHQLTLAYESADINARISAAGAYGDNKWSAAVNDVNLSSPVTGLWQQSAAASLKLDADAATLKGLCLNQLGLNQLGLQPQGQLCMDATHSQAGLKADIVLRDTPLELIQPWLPEQTSTSGTVDAEIHYNRGDGGQRGTLSLATRNAGLAYTAGEEGRHSFPAQLTIAGQLEGDALAADGQFLLADTVDVRLSVKTTLGAEHPLAGELSVAVQNLQWLEALTTGVESPAGHINGNLSVGGTAASPQLAGDIQLNDFAAKIPLTGTAISDGSANLNIAGDGNWQLVGTLATTAATTATTATGTASISGVGTLASLRQGDLALELEGENLTLIDLPDNQIQASPRLQLQVQDDHWDISGELEIPQAEITLRPLPEGAVAPSGDEIVTPPLAVAKKVNPTTVNLNLLLGDQVHIQGHGLDTRLAGNLKYQRSASGASSALGQIDLRQGSYKAYGRKLKITRGHLIFQGDLENPGLNIESVRKMQKGEVGLRITGELDQIESMVFSDPVLPPTEALILLMTGKDPADITQDDAGLIMGAASALGIKQQASIASRLQNTFGLDVLGVQNVDNTEGSSLMFGKRLSPKLMVSYARSLFSTQSSFILQYQINDQLGLKAESGEFQSIDVNYTIEH